MGKRNLETIKLMHEAWKIRLKLMTNVLVSLQIIDGIVISKKDVCLKKWLLSLADKKVLSMVEILKLCCHECRRN